MSLPAEAVQRKELIENVGGFALRRRKDRRIGVEGDADVLRALGSSFARRWRSDGPSCSVSRLPIGWWERAAHWAIGMSHTHLPVSTRHDVTPQGTSPHTGAALCPDAAGFGS